MISIIADYSGICKKLMSNFSNTTTYIHPVYTTKWIEQSLIEIQIPISELDLFTFQKSPKRNNN